MHISYYGFVFPVNILNEKYTTVKKNNFFDIFFWEKIDIMYSWIISKYFRSDKYYSYS